MNKKWYQSKTIIGFGAVALAQIYQLFQLPYFQSKIFGLIQILGTFFGLFGVRDSIGNIKILNKPSKVIK